MAHVTGAAVLIEIDEQQYWMSPLSDKSIEEVNTWIRGRYIDMVRKSFGPDMTREDKDSELAIAFREARKLSFMSIGDSSPIDRLDVIARTIWQGIEANKSRNPPIDFSAVRTFLMNPENVDYAMRAWKEANVSPSLEGGASSNGQAKKQRHRQTRQSSTQS